MGAADVTKWGEWVDAPPLTGPPIEITAETCEIRPRVRHDGRVWRAVPVDYRGDAGSTWQTRGQVCAWARPRGTSGWPYAALTYLTMCDITPADPRGYTYSHPRWRTVWVAYDPELIRPVEPYEPPSAFWLEQLGDALGEFAGWLGIDEPHR